MIEQLQSTFCAKELTEITIQALFCQKISRFGFFVKKPNMQIIFCKFERDDKTLSISSLEFALSLAGTLCHVGQFCAPFQD